MWVLPIFFELPVQGHQLFQSFCRKKRQPTKQSVQWTLPDHVIKLCGHKRQVATHMREEVGSTTHFNECSEKNVYCKEVIFQDVEIPFCRRVYKNLFQIMYNLQRKENQKWWIFRMIVVQKRSAILKVKVMFWAYCFGFLHLGVFILLWWNPQAFSWSCEVLIFRDSWRLVETEDEVGFVLFISYCVPYCGSWIIVVSRIRD